MDEIVKNNSSFEMSGVIEEEALKMLSNPKLFVATINNMAQKLDADKAAAQELKDMNGFKRFFKSSSKIQAEANLRQNDIMHDFYQLLTALSFLSKGNSALLLGLYNSLCESEKANGMEGNTFFEMAKSNLQTAIDSAKNEELREKALKKALVENKVQQDKLAEQKSNLDKTNSKLDEFKKKVMQKIKVSVELVRSHINVKVDKTQEYINSKISASVKYNNEQIHIINSRLEENQKIAIQLIESLTKDLSTWKIVAICSIIFNVINLILIFVLK